MRKISIPKTLLYKLYVEQGLTTYQISDELGVSRQTVCNKLKEFKIPTRDFLFQPKPKKVVERKTSLYRNKIVFALAYKKFKSLDLVAEYFGISTDTAYKWKVRHNIKTIKQVSKRGIDRRMEGKPWYNKELFAQYYEKYSTTQLAKMWNCNPTTLQKWLKKYEIPSKTTSESWKRKAQNGVVLTLPDGSFDLQKFKEHYSVDRPLHHKVANLIKDAVGCCQSCGETEILDIHHIDENRMNNRPENHAILCPNCHARIHRLGMTIEQLVPDFRSWSEAK